MVPHCLWGQEGLLPWILATCHLGHSSQQRHLQLHVCEQQENTQQVRPTGVQQPRTSLTLGKGTGKKEGTKRTQHARLSPATSDVTWNGRGGGSFSQPWEQRSETRCWLLSSLCPHMDIPLCSTVSRATLLFFFNEMWSPYVARLSLNSLSLPEQLKCWDWWVCSTSPG